MPDVDIDFFDRDETLKLFKHTPASIIKNDKTEKHKTGVYFHAIPINIFLKGDFRYFRTTLVTLNSKDIKIVHGPTVRLSDISKKRVKRRTIQLVRKPV